MVRTANKNELLPGTLEMLILQTLTRSAMHGYGIAQHIQEITDEVLQVEEGSLYPALQRLLLKGWVKGEWGTSDNNRRARYYTLTAAGRKQLGIEAENFKRLMEAIARVMQTA
jgi:PadR family transcriptional regulator PadR